MKIYKFLLLNFLLILASGCQHTVEGFGKDMQQNGQEVQKSVNN